MIPSKYSEMIKDASVPRVGGGDPMYYWVDADGV